MNQEIKPIMMLLSIVESPQGKKLMDKLNNMNITMHMQSVGHGTAPTEMMDIFGLGNNTKDVIFSFATKDRIQNLMLNFGDNFSSYSKYKGLMMVLSLSSMNRLVAGILNQNNVEIQIEGEEKKMKNTHSHTIVMISVVHGYSDEVMEVAKKAGATGGTVINGRFVESEALNELALVDGNEEREILFILAPVGVGHQIMKDVNQEYGFKSKANGILWTVPVEKAYKI